MSKDGVGCGDAIVAGQRQVHGAAHAVAADGGDYGNRKVVDGQHERLATAGKLKSFWSAELGNLVQIGPGGKELAIAGDDEGLSTASICSQAQLLYDLMQGCNRVASQFVCAIRRDKLKNGAIRLDHERK